MGSYLNLIVISPNLDTMQQTNLLHLLQEFTQCLQHHNEKQRRQQIPLSQTIGQSEKRG